VYLHVGNGKSVREEDIIGIFDLDTATVSKISKDFINRKQKAGLVEYTDTDLPRAFLLIDEGGKKRGKRKKSSVLLSRISTSCLEIRSYKGK
jgi:hypothetical protein